MTVTTLQERIATALQGVAHPRLGTDVLTAEAVRDIGTTLDGKVRLTVLLAASDDAELVRDIRDAVQAVDGVADVRVDVKDPAQYGREQTAAEKAANAEAAARHAPAAAPSAPPKAPRALPVMDSSPPAAPRNVAPPAPVAYPHRHLVGQGRGGQEHRGREHRHRARQNGRKRVGIMDADIYGPNMPLMLGVDAAPAVRDEKIIPLEAHGIKVISLGFLIEKDQPAIWRGPIVMKIITQFLRDVNWGQLDYFLVDMPPGTGDAQLSLVQATQVHGAVIVTTPQQVAVGDALRGVKMFERTAVPVLGIVENMSYFENPGDGQADRAVRQWWRRAPRQGVRPAAARAGADRSAHPGRW
jgi:ATP-binding protein involved in chromosome partitioning